MQLLARLISPEIPHGRLSYSLFLLQ